METNCSRSHWQVLPFEAFESGPESSLSVALAGSEFVVRELAARLFRHLGQRAVG